MEERRALSRRLYHVLEEVGASEELRTLHRETATVLEIADTVSRTFFTDKICTSYYCGSSYEGTVTPDLASDRDIIGCASCDPVVHHVRDAPPGLSFLVVRDSYTYPGYVKLQLVLNRKPQTDQDGLQFNTALDGKGRVCVKHFQNPNMQGPASQGIDEHGFHVIDTVPAFRCETIPPFAREWFQQQKHHGRQSEEQVNAMSGLGCMFVGAGHVNSMEKDIEWRMSFSLQERLLLSNLNPVQHKAYIMLKMIKKNILSAEFNTDSLTSYHFKTCILFTVQMTPAHAWTADNLISCLLQCLKLMIRWLDRRNCPNYFVNELNLFVKAGFSRRLMCRLLHVVDRIVEGDTQFLSLIQSDNVGKILMLGECKRYRELSAVKANEYTANLKLTCSRHTGCYVMKVLRAHCHDPVWLAAALTTLQKTESINEHTFDVTQSALAYMYPWLNLHIAKGFVSLTYRYQGAGNHQQMLDEANFHFNEAKDADLVNERLARVAVLFKAGQFKECYLLLQQTENEFNDHVSIICPCSSRCSSLYRDEQDKHSLDRKIAQKPMQQFIKSLTASCVVFLPFELEITPVPLQHEMRRSHGTLPGSRVELYHYWFDWAVIDPKIFLYFLQYLVSARLNKEPYKQVALDKLRAEITLDVNHGLLNHKDTAYNLLGWIHAQEGRPADAWRCFSESWKIRPYHNAAKFHMQDLCEVLKDVLQKALSLSK